MTFWSCCFFLQCTAAWWSLETLRLVAASPETGYKITLPTLKIQAGGFTLYIENYTLHLVPQELPSCFTNTFFKDNREVAEHDFAECIYRGSVENHTDWTVLLNLCNGILGHFGDTDNSEQYYHIEPLDLKSEKSSIEQPHIFYSESVQQSANLSTGMCAKSLLPDFHRRETITIKKQRLTPMASQMFEPGERIVELVLVNDHSQYLHFGNKLASVILRDIEIVDYMNQRYRPLNISVALVSVVTWTEGDQINMPDDMDPAKLLMAFKEYYYRIRGHFDCAMLISGKDFKDSVVGLAYKSAMCYGKYSVGVVQDRRPTLAAVGTTAAHEMGHILGMSHDELDGRSCACKDPSGKCIMASVAPLMTQSTLWSNCSITDMLLSFATYPVSESCLYNEPASANLSMFETDNATANCTGTSNVSVRDGGMTVFLASILMLTFIVGNVFM